MLKLVIFDLDGTLVDAYTAIHQSLNFTLKKLGYSKVGLDTCRRAVGWGDKTLVAKFVRPPDAADALALYRRHHKHSLLKHARVLPQVAEILSRLRAKKIKLAIASNRPLKFTNILLRHLDLKKYFAVVSCAKNRNEFKPNPLLLERIIRLLKVKKAEALYVGDMAVDVYAGKNAGIRTIAVKGGSSRLAEIRKAVPDKIISGISRLGEVL
ncbi:MAG: HAD family hydrolase [Candidatus Omnitrophica bacterium]|nr:HAD family hydrolase [Candidatus Omnitrophota bacterium]MDD5236430.1 HAD family hydrolase [Candidatus Omnitrophota bacterium]MDD5611295.1 HAD family hydrolase [Candidatus Omnitrophota bacterium]